MPPHSTDPEIAAIGATLGSVGHRLDTIDSKLEKLVTVGEALARMRAEMDQQSESIERGWNEIERHKTTFYAWRDRHERETDERCRNLEHAIDSTKAELRKWVHVAQGAWFTATILWVLFGAWITQSVQILPK